MSAWVVEKEHIDVLIRYGLSKPSERIYWQNEEREWIWLSFENATEVGRMLAEENVASVCYRYEDDTAELYEDLLGYEYRDPGYTLTAREALKAINCLDYQSCEHPGWEDSQAKRVLDALQARAIGELCDGPWGWDAAELAKRPKTYALV